MSVLIGHCDSTSGSMPTLQGPKLQNTQMGLESKDLTAHVSALQHEKWAGHGRAVQGFGIQVLRPSFPVQPAELKGSRWVCFSSGCAMPN